MKKQCSILMIALAVCAFQACNNSGKDSKSAADSANSSKDTTTTGKTGISVDKDDAKFAVDAANGGMAEVELGKLAQQQATDSKVKDFGAMMVSDHSKANDELKALAKTKNITLPDSIGGDEKKSMTDLTKKTGRDFDKAYVNDMVDDHKKDVKEFEDATKNLKDPDLKAFAVKTLPVLKSHLAAITAIHDKMK